MSCDLCDVTVVLYSMMGDLVKRAVEQKDWVCCWLVGLSISSPPHTGTGGCSSETTSTCA